MVTDALLPLSLCLCLCPLPGQDPAPTRLDVVELKNGDQLTGRITAELDGYVEVELEQGAVVGVSRAQVQSIRRAAVEQPQVGAAVAPADAWFVLHDAAGASVGWLHSATTTNALGGFTVSEEYEFAEGVRRYRVTNLCTADAGGRAVSSYFRERIAAPAVAAQSLPVADPSAIAEHTLRERIVEARCEPGRLVVQRLDGSGRDERVLPWTDEMTFPLLARTLAREARLDIGPVTMFESSTEQLVERRVDGTGARQVVLDGERRRVAEVAEFSASGRNSEWVDANLRTVRRELAGPSLVAVPSSRESARLAVGATRIAAAIVPEADGRFGLWAPNPSWVAAEDLPAGHVALRCTVYDAEIRLSCIDHLEPGTLLDSAAEAVERWLALLYPALTVEGRSPVRVRDREGVRFELAGRRPRAGRRATVDVVADDGCWLVLQCSAPAEAWDELQADFDFVVRTVELEPESLSPPLQGPVAERAERRGRAPGAGAAAPRGGRLPGPTVETPTRRAELDRSVRIPQ